MRVMTKKRNFYAIIVMVAFFSSNNNDRSSDGMEYYAPDIEWRELLRIFAYVIHPTYYAWRTEVRGSAASEMANEVTDAEQSAPRWTVEWTLRGLCVRRRIIST